jgi:LPS export ABC transporter protein LptC
MSKAKAFLLLAFVLIAGGAILLVITSPREPVASRQSQAQKVSLRGYDENGVLIWSLAALEGDIKNDTGTLTDVEVIFYEEETARLQATADTLTFAGKEATLSGEVEILHDDYRLQTEALSWLESEEMLTAGQATIFFEAASVEAEAFSYSLKTEEALLKGGVTSTLDHTGHRWQVSAEQAEAKDGRLILSEEVLVEGEDAFYRCTSLDYNREKEEVSLSGDVEGRFNSGTICADTVTLNSEGTLACGKVNLQLEPSFFTRN